MKKNPNSKTNISHEIMQMKTDFWMMMLKQNISRKVDKIEQNLSSWEFRGNDLFVMFISNY